MNALAEAYAAELTSTFERSAKDNISRLDVNIRHSRTGPDLDELFAKDGVVLQPDTAYWRCTNGVTTDN